MTEITVDPAELAAFWSEARTVHPELPAEPPEAWAFGATAAHADELLELVLAGIKTGTASAMQDYEAEDEPLPVEGELSVVLDGAGRPRAVIRTTELRTMPFDEVTAEHAWAEGEDDRSLEAWRRIHERFWGEHSAGGFSPDMLVLCERFELVHPRGAE